MPTLLTSYGVLSTCSSFQATPSSSAILIAAVRTCSSSASDGTTTSTILSRAYVTVSVTLTRFVLVSFCLVMMHSSFSFLCVRARPGSGCGVPTSRDRGGLSSCQALCFRLVSEAAMDWLDCEVIERVPGRMSGAPVLRHSRVRPEDLLANLEEGPEWLAEQHDLPLADVVSVIAFYRRHQDQLAPAP